MAKKKRRDAASFLSFQKTEDEFRIYKTKQSEFMKTERRTTISLYGKTYNELNRYKKAKESAIGYRLTFQQLLALMLSDIRAQKEMNRDEQRKLF